MQKLKSTLVLIFAMIFWKNLDVAELRYDLAITAEGGR